MAAKEIKQPKFEKSKFKPLTTIKESTLKDLDFYIFHGCGD